MHLYLDTSSSLCLGGFFSDEFVCQQYAIEKSSQELHQKLFELLKDRGGIGSLESFVYCAGPGSYTGLRLGKGIADLLKLNGVKIYSYCDFEIPYFLGHNKGMWLSKAYKGEYFIYSWNEEAVETSLVANENLGPVLQKSSLDEMWCPTEDPFLEELMSGLGKKLIQTKKVRTENFTEFFTYLLAKRPFRELFYYRSLEKEFRKMV